MKALQWVLLTASLGALACGGPQGYVIRGEVTGFPDSTMLYLANLNTQTTVDSALVVDGRFQMRGVLAEEPERMQLYTQVDQRHIYAPLLIGNDNIEVKGDIGDFPFQVSVSGSKYQDQAEAVNALSREYDLQISTLADTIWKIPDERRKEPGVQALLKQYREVIQCMDSIRTAYLFSHTDTYPALIRLGYKMYDFQKDTVQMLFDRMSPELQASRYARPIRTFLTSEFVTTGGPFLDFKAEDQNGRPVRLSELVGRDGKYTLLEFTSSGCGPCMQAAEEMRRMIDTYSDSLLIVSFSIDKSREYWQESLKRDSVCWTSLWSTREAENNAVSIPYKVRSYPYFFVIDPQGTIVQRWSGYGPDTFEKKIGRLKNK